MNIIGSGGGVQIKTYSLPEKLYGNTLVDMNNHLLPSDDWASYDIKSLELNNLSQITISELRTDLTTASITYTKLSPQFTQQLNQIPIESRIKLGRNTWNLNSFRFPDTSVLAGQLLDLAQNITGSQLKLYELIVSSEQLPKFSTWGSEISIFIPLENHELTGNSSNFFEYIEASNNAQYLIKKDLTQHKEYIPTHMHHTWDLNSKKLEEDVQSGSITPKSIENGNLIIFCNKHFSTNEVCKGLIHRYSQNNAETTKYLLATYRTQETILPLPWETRISNRIETVDTLQYAKFNKDSITKVEPSELPENSKWGIWSNS